MPELIMRCRCENSENKGMCRCENKGMFGSTLVSWLKLVRLKSFSHPLIWKQELKCIKRALKSLFLSPFLFSLLSQGGHGLELLAACMWSLMRKEEEEILVPFRPVSIGFHECFMHIKYSATSAKFHFLHETLRREKERVSPW
jgi:hypothetical protein